MALSAHRITGSVVAVVCQGAREKLACLNVGSILIPTSQPDRAGMIEATCEDVTVRIFRRDLEERAVEIAAQELGSLTALHGTL
jgi:hypothetical protein